MEVSKANFSKIRPLQCMLNCFQVNVSVHALSISSPDETSLQYEFQVIITQKYVDPRLQFKPYRGGYVSFVFDRNSYYLHLYIIFLMSSVAFSSVVQKADIVNNRICITSLQSLSSRLECLPILGQNLDSSFTSR